jgi:hypothetical protein
MSIRTRIFGPGADEPLLRAKAPKGAKPDMLDTVIVPRAETRRGNVRAGDRHRLTAEQAILRHQGHEHVVELINLSAGGAMIRSPVELVLWDQVGLVLGETGEIDCAVRWLKEDRAGLEFAHETRIDCEREEHDALLRAVIRKSFPDSDVALHQPTEPHHLQRIETPQAADSRADRHPLVWTGIIYYDEAGDRRAEPVRLRNISATGALVQSGNALPEGETVYLDMRSSGRHAATVVWCRGDQAGLEFHERFDLQALSNTRPEIASNENSPRPAFETQGPWAPGWNRSTLNDLARNLGG